jgi:hypothetical protein
MSYGRHAQREGIMVLQSSLARTSLATAVLLSATALGSVTPAGAAADYPRMTVVIYNNSPDYTIYPVLSTGAAKVGQWLQAYMEVPKKDLDKRPYEKVGQFRLYLGLNDKGLGDGIPPKGEMRLTLPVATQIEKDADGKTPNQLADWWGGGRIEIFAAPAKDKKPPQALIDAVTIRDKQTKITPKVDNPQLPKCVKGCSDTTPQIYHDPAGLEHNMPLQLTEYTLGAVNDKKDPMTINPFNVDYDVSYVDTAFLPVAMEPFDNEQVGYVGMVTSIDDFNTGLNKFLDDYPGWPLMVNPKVADFVKVPSPLNVLGRNLKETQTDLSPIPKSQKNKGEIWKPMQTLVDNYTDCIDNKKDGKFCDNLREIQTLFSANFQNYKDNFKKWNCEEEHRASGDKMSMIGHIYGWTPFNDGCKNAKLNLLEDTAGYSDNNYKKYFEVKSLFDDLQLDDSGKFDPYVLLIHDKKYLNAKNVYAYSVDDALGNMQVDGSGLILAVGGKERLPNPDEATPPVHVAFGSSKNDKVNFVNYRICTTGKKRDVNPDFTSFDISLNNIKGCVLTLWDDNKPARVYQFKITQQPPFPPGPGYDNETKKMVNCNPTRDAAAKAQCQNNAFGYTRVLPREEVSTISFPNPVQPAKQAFDISVGGDPNDKVKYVKRGQCTDKPDIAFKNPGAFTLPLDKAKNCTVSLIDDKDRVYLFQINMDKVPFPAKASKDVIDCSLNKDADIKKWCNDFAQGYSTGSGDQLVNHVIFPQAIQPSKKRATIAAN